MRPLLDAWYDLRDLSNPIERLLDWVNGWGPDWLAYVLSAVIGGVAIFAFAAAAGIINSWIERRAIGRIQMRLGPNRVGPFGLLQPIADAGKLLLKEPLFPGREDVFMFILAPVAVALPGLMILGVLPFGPGMTFVDLNVGVVYILALSSLVTLAVFMAGWSSNNKFSLVSAMRAIAMLISYEVPMVLALLGPVIFAGTMSLNGIVGWQQDHNVWLFLLQPLAVIVYLISGTADLNRTPSDIAEAESEIVAGYHTEYSGMRFGLFYAVELVNAIALAGIMATLFFGGWWLYGLDRWVPGWFVFLGKAYVFYLALVWLRGTLPRLRIDQLLGLAWKLLLPLALVNVFLSAFEVLIWVEYEVSAGIVLPLFAVVNLALAVVLVASWGRLLSRRYERLPKRALLVREIGGAPVEEPAPAS